MPSYGDIELASWSEPARQEAGALTAGDVVAAIEKACGGLTAWPGGSVAREACLALVDRYAAQVAKQAVADALSFDGVDATRKNVEREVNEARQRAEAAERDRAKLAAAVERANDRCTELQYETDAALARERGLREAAERFSTTWSDARKKAFALRNDGGFSLKHWTLPESSIVALDSESAVLREALASKPASEPVAHHVLVDGAPYVASLDCCEATTHALEKERDALLAESTRRGMLIAALEAQRAKAPDAASELERAADALGERVELQAAKRDLRARAAALRGGEARGACGECERRERLLAMYRGEMRVIGEALAHTRENDKPAGEVEP